MIIFDLDGTLVDSSNGIYHSYDYSCSTNSIQPVKYENFIAHIGPPIDLMLDALHSGLSNSLKSNISSVFTSHYAEVGCKQYSFKPGLHAFLGYLSSIEPLYILTNKKTSIALDMMSEYSPYFQSILGRDFFSTQSQDKSSVARAFFNFVPSNEIVYVGDTQGDLELSTSMSWNFFPVQSLFLPSVNNILTNCIGTLSQCYDNKVSLDFLYKYFYV